MDLTNFQFRWQNNSDVFDIMANAYPLPDEIPVIDVASTLLTTSTIYFHNPVISMFSTDRCSFGWSYGTL